MSYQMLLCWSTISPARSRAVMPSSPPLLMCVGGRGRASFDITISPSPERSTRIRLNADGADSKPVQSVEVLNDSMIETYRNPSA